MNEYVLFIGASNTTGSREIDKAREVLDKSFKGYTIALTAGSWEGRMEDSYTVTIFTDKTLDEMSEIVKELCGVLEQFCIIVRYKMDAGIKFIEA